jgi:hypothetical protein
VARISTLLLHGSGGRTEWKEGSLVEKLSERSLVEKLSERSLVGKLIRGEATTN